MPKVIWNNLTSGTVSWAAIIGVNPKYGPLGPQKTYEMDSSGVDFAGWKPENFTGLMVVSLPQSTGDNVVVYATKPSLEGEALINELKPGTAK